MGIRAPYVYEFSDRVLTDGALIVSTEVIAVLCPRWINAYSLVSAVGFTDPSCVCAVSKEQLRRRSCTRAPTSAATIKQQTTPPTDAPMMTGSMPSELVGPTELALETFGAAVFEEFDVDIVGTADVDNGVGAIDTVIARRAGGEGVGG